MSEHQGPSSFEVSQQMQAAHNNARSGASLGGGGGGHGMLPVEGKHIDLAMGSVEDMLKGGNMDEMIAGLNAGGGAFGQTISDQLASTVSHLGTKEAQGEQGLKLESLGQGERVTPPTAQGDLQLKALSARGSGGHEAG